MTIPTWPSQLPCPERSSYQAQRANSRLAKQGNGPTGYRRRFSSVPRLVVYSIDVPRSLKAVFDNFYEVTTADGALPFRMPDPVTDGWPMLTSDGQYMLDINGTPLLLSKMDLCLFGQEPPSETIKSARFEISFSVQVMP